jgi:tetratricopeptide (TPR) repeat protein
MRGHHPRMSGTGRGTVLTGELGTWLREQREARGWARRDMARRLIQAGHDTGDTTMPSIDSLCTYIRRWEHGHGLTERYKLHYCTALAIPPAQFGQAPAHHSPGMPVPADSRLVTTVTVAYRGIHKSDLDGSTVEREMLMTAHESSDHAEQAAQAAVGDVTFEQLHADVTRLARLSDTGEPFAVFLEMRRVRDRIYRLLDRRLWPREQTDLYFLLGCLNGLMGVAAIRLSYPDTAEELHRAGWAYANAIDHRPLMAWLRCKLSSVAFVRGRFEESRDQARTGLEYLAAGPIGANLHTQCARAAGRLGDTDTARQAVHDAHEAFERDYHDELLEIGGEYVISKATHYYNAGDALIAIASADSDAAGELERAIGLYDQGPGEREEHWFAGKPLAGIDLAVAQLRTGALDAAAVALEPAFLLPPTQRISDVTIRLAAVRDELAAPVFRGSGQARALGEQIEEFGRETIVAGLHSLPG